MRSQTVNDAVTFCSDRLPLDVESFAGDQHVFERFRPTVLKDLGDLLAREVGEASRSRAERNPSVRFLMSSCDVFEFVDQGVL